MIFNDYILHQVVVCSLAAYEHSPGGGAPLRCLYDGPDRRSDDIDQHPLLHSVTQSAADYSLRRRPLNVQSRLVLLARLHCRYINQTRNRITDR